MVSRPIGRPAANDNVRVYLAVFRTEHYSTDPCGKAWAPLSRAIERGEWPFDGGDDPSFFSSRKNHANVTWGVCRQQVRNSIRPDDIVVFFSVGQTNERTFEYRLCALTTVETKVRHSDIWTDKNLSVYRKYLNLLIRPHRTGVWEHFEPGSESPHKDWIWRIVKRGHLRLEHFEQHHRKATFREDHRINGLPVSFADNYVIFSHNSSKTFVIKNPPVVAACLTNRTNEIWSDDLTSHKIREYTLGAAFSHGSKRRSLRTVHQEHSHPVIRWALTREDADCWRQEFIGFLSNAFESV